MGGVLGGPPVATAWKMVAGLFGADPESPEEVMNAIQGDPDAMMKIREFEMKHQQKLQTLELEETKSFLAYFGSANDRGRFW